MEQKVKRCPKLQGGHNGKDSNNGNNGDSDGNNQNLCTHFTYPLPFTFSLPVTSMHIPWPSFSLALFSLYKLLVRSAQDVPGIEDEDLVFHHGMAMMAKNIQNHLGAVRGQ